MLSLKCAMAMAVLLGVLLQGGVGASLAGMTFVQICILIVVVAAIVALVYVGLQALGIGVPPWLAKVFWIVVAAFFVIVAIKLVASMW